MAWSCRCAFWASETRRCASRSGERRVEAGVTADQGSPPPDTPTPLAAPRALPVTRNWRPASGHFSPWTPALPFVLTACPSWPRWWGIYDDDTLLATTQGGHAIPPPPPTTPHPPPRDLSSIHFLLLSTSRRGLTRTERKRFAFHVLDLCVPLSEGRRLQDFAPHWTVCGGDSRVILLCQGSHWAYKRGRRQSGHPSLPGVALGMQAGGGEANWESNFTWTIYGDWKAAGAGWSPTQTCTERRQTEGCLKWTPSPGKKRDTWIRMLAIKGEAAGVEYTPLWRWRCWEKIAADEFIIYLIIEGL